VSDNFRGREDSFPPSHGGASQGAQSKKSPDSRIQTVHPSDSRIRACLVLDSKRVFFRIGKGESNWDFWSHMDNGSNIVNGQNGDVACDSYHKYKDDVALLKNMGVQSACLNKMYPNFY